jgi:peroxiredoxin Q/BCP
MLNVGDAAPDFSTTDQAGNPVALADFKGRQVVLYFYPKDSTPGCTIEARAFRDAFESFKKKGAAVLGVSKDSPGSHKKFADKEGLPFPLLMDEDMKIIKAYEAWGDRSIVGRIFSGVMRKTFLIGPDGRIRAVFPHVSPSRHAQEVLAALE